MAKRTWRFLPARYPLCIAVPEWVPGQTQVWAFDLRADPQTVQSWHNSLSSQEVQRAARFARPHLRERFIVAHGLKRALLAQYLRCPPNHIDLDTLPGGKPVLSDVHQSALQFNLSHTQDYLLIAFGQHALGVDIECDNPRVAVLDIAQRYFAAQEIQGWADLPTQTQRARFYRTWVAKEALLKAQGLGVGAGLADWPIPPPTEDADPPVNLGAWRITWLEAGDQRYAALATPSDAQLVQICHGDWLENGPAEYGKR